MFRPDKPHQPPPENRLKMNYSRATDQSEKKNSPRYYSGARDIVFCFHEPILETIDSPYDKIYILLRAELQFAETFKNLEYLTLESFITPEIYALAEKKVDLEWQALIHSPLVKNLCYYKYDFLNLRFTGTFLELIIENIIKLQNCRKVFIPFYVSEDFRCYSNPSLQLVEFSDRFNKVVLDNYIREIGVAYGFYSERIVPTTTNMRRLRRSLIIPLEFIAVLWIAIKKALSIIGKFKSIIGKFRFERSDRPFLSLCIQGPKNRRLIQQIRLNGIDYKIIDLGSLRRSIECCGNKNSSFEINVSATDVAKGPLHVIRIWLMTLSEFHDLAFDLYKTDEISSMGNFFITDADHCPLIARISNYFGGRDGYSIVLIPEGATYVNPFSQTLRFTLDNHRNLFRGFASNSHESLYLRQINASKSTFVCGYSTSVFGARIISIFLKLYLQLIHFSVRRKIIFLDLVPLFSPDIGISRSNLRDKSRVFSEIRILLQTLGNQCIVCTNDRAWSADYDLLLENRVLRLPFHWSILAYSADVTISRQSSIIFECVNEKIPIIIWDPFLDCENTYSPLISTFDNMLVDRADVLRGLLDEGFAFPQAKRKIDSNPSGALSYEFIFNLFRQRSQVTHP